MESFLRPAERTHKARWIRKLQRLGLDYEVAVLEELTGREDLDLVESFWIAQLRGMGNQLTNAGSGGPGTRGMKFSAEHKAKISAAQTGDRAHWYGKQMPGATRVKMSRSHGGKPVIDSNGVTYATVAEAARLTGLDESGIRSVLKGRIASIGGGKGHASVSRGQGLKFTYAVEGIPING